jgi:hypothetical protein
MFSMGTLSHAILEPLVPYLSVNRESRKYNLNERRDDLELAFRNSL